MTGGSNDYASNGGGAQQDPNASTSSQSSTGTSNAQTAPATDNGAAAGQTAGTDQTAGTQKSKAGTDADDQGKLPKTATPLPVIGFLGLGLLIAGLAAGRTRRALD